MKPVSKVTLSDIPDIVRIVCMEFVVVRSAHEMAQFQEGLDTLHVASLLKLHPSTIEQLFTYSCRQVTAHDLIHLLIPVYSPRGSNAREEEEAIILNWNDYLQDLEGVETLLVSRTRARTGCDTFTRHIPGIIGLFYSVAGTESEISPSSVLSFVTGSPTIPPMGFDRTINIHFIDDKSKTLPTASTCSLVLRLPLALVEYQQFKQMMDFAIQNTIGFGQV